MPEQFRETFQFYLARGMAGRVGFGERPAILVVDMTNGFTDPRSPLAASLEGPIKEIQRVLEVARARGLPVIFTTVFYEPDLSDAGLWPKKIPAASVLARQSGWVEVDARLERRADEMLLVKKYASCFFGTDLASRLVSRRVDTLIVTGCTTSGCVRASVVDACSFGFHTIVPQEAVGDRAELPHLANLFDMDAKYADVVSVDETLDYLSTR